MKKSNLLILLFLFFFAACAANASNQIPDKSKWKASASSPYAEDDSFGPGKACDGQKNTRWSSPFSDPQWIQIDLGSSAVLCGITILWEDAFSSKYHIQTSLNGKKWKTVYRNNNGNGRTDDIYFAPVNAQFIRIIGTSRGTGWGHSIWEIDIKGLDRQPKIKTFGQKGYANEFLFDGNLETEWHSSTSMPVIIDIDFRYKIQFTGLKIDWGKNFAKSIKLLASCDGKKWELLDEIEDGSGMFDVFMNPRKEIQFIRLQLSNPKNNCSLVINEIYLRAPDEEENPLSQYQLAAQKSRPGLYPDVLRNRQTYWTVVGLPHDSEESLLDEYGTFEPKAGSCSITPFIWFENSLHSALDSKNVNQNLEDDYLPLPSVNWDVSGKVKFNVQSFAAGSPTDSATYIRYSLLNLSGKTQKCKLFLTVRPVQVNPSWQHGGLSPINSLEFKKSKEGMMVKVNNQISLISLTSPNNFGARGFKRGDIIEDLKKSRLPQAKKLSDGGNYISGALVYDITLKPNGHAEIIIAAPLHKLLTDISQFVRTKSVNKVFSSELKKMKKFWHSKLDKVKISIPNKDAENTLKSQIAYILINADGDAIQPGSRNYKRCWIRDGSLTSAALLRMGCVDEVRNYLEWYASRVQSDGLVPPILNNNGSLNTGYGSDLEYDSQGQFIYAIMEFYRFTHDRKFLERHFPKIKNAMKYMAELSKKTLAKDYLKEDPARKRFSGIFPKSYSHEGYNPPMHSYWDDFWGLKGWKDGITAAKILGYNDIARWGRKKYLDFRKNVQKSIKLTMEEKNIDFIPGCAEKGDSDPTSIAIALFPCDEKSIVSDKIMKNTFEKYYHELVERDIPGWQGGFTPYEIRSIMAFVKFDQPERGLKLLESMLNFRRPKKWNHLAEVAFGDARLPNYIGDMPHTWVGSGYVNSLRGMLAYENNDKLILMAGVPEKWVRSKNGIFIKKLPTHFGLLNLSAKADDNFFTVKIDMTSYPPKGIDLYWPIQGWPIKVTVDGDDWKDYNKLYCSLPKGAKKIVAEFKDEINEAHLDEVLSWMKINQDTTLPGKNLLASSYGGGLAQTFDNSLAALAFITLGEKERAERILDFYQNATVKNNTDPLLQNFFLNGEPRGFFQYMAVRDMDDAKKFHAARKSDRWMGDMAWLFMACKQYELKFNSNRYNHLINLIANLFKSWYIPENGGGYIGSGWRQLDVKLHEKNGHHEGNIDAYAVFKMIGDDNYADKISRWLLPLIEGENRPLDLFAWKVLAFAPGFADDLNILEITPGYKKTCKFHGKNVVGFTSSRNNHTNIWTDGLGHIVCAYEAIGNSEKADFYLRQMDKLVMRKLINGQQTASLPYTATNSPGYEWVNPDKGCLSGAAWYIMARKKFNPMQLE